MNRLFINKEWSPLKKLLFMNAASGGNLTEYTATGNPATFNTNVSKPLKQLLIPFTPVQEGSGDPSPSNVRPITGWTGVNVTANGTTIPVMFPALGMNLFDKNAVETGKLWWKGYKQNDSNFSASALIPVIPGEQYTIDRNATGQATICYFDEEGEYLDQNVSNPSTFTIPLDVYYVAFNVRTDSLNDAMFSKGTSASPYEPYTNTVYGGTLDLTTGVLTVTHWIADLGNCTWQKFNSGTYADLYYTDRLASAIGATTGDETHGVCSEFAVVDNDTHSGADGTTTAQPYNSMRFRSSDGRIYLKVAGYSTAEEMKQGVSGVQLAYELATERVFHLDPVSIQTLIGDNVIFSDTNGENTVKYLKKG